MILDIVTALAVGASGPSILAQQPVSDEVRPGKILSSPNWSDYRNYPDEARHRDQEGLVAFALRVDRTGKVAECLVVESSGFASLDESTCALATQMRFEAARDQMGKATESVYRTRVFWLLDDPRPVASSTLDADLTYDGEKLIECAVRGTGPYFQPWKSVVCQNAQIYPQKLAGQPKLFSRMTLSIRVDVGENPVGLTNWPVGTTIARDFTNFSVNSDGDASECTVDEDKDIFSNDFRSHHPCGYFLSTIWFETPEKGEQRPRGRYELRLTGSPEQ